MTFDRVDASALGVDCLAIRDVCEARADAASGVPTWECDGSVSLADAASGVPTWECDGSVSLADAASGVPTIHGQPGPGRQWLGILLVVVILLLFVLSSFKLTMQNYHVQGHSMEPTLLDQEYVLVNKTAYLFQPPARGDIIVFQYPLNRKEDYIKRIIAIPGDVISIHDQTVIVDNSTLHEIYVNKDDPFNPFASFDNHIVGPGQYFVMGDNRGNSSDSRLWGLVPRQNILGKAIITYWPLGEKNLGLLPNDGSVFAKIHQ